MGRRADEWTSKADNTDIERESFNIGKTCGFFRILCTRLRVVVPVNLLARSLIPGAQRATEVW